MNNVDEKIAKLKMQQKIEKARILEENAQKQEKSQDEDLSSVEDIIKQISEGIVKKNGNTFVFRKKIYLDGKIEIPVPLNYFEERLNEENNFALVNDLHGVSLNGTYITQNVKKQKFSEFKEGMKQGFKAMNIYAEWLEEGSFGKEEHEKIYYASYKTPTAKGELYNFLFYRQYNKTMFIGNYNCFYKEIEIWEPIIKASVLLMKIN